MLSRQTWKLIRRYSPFLFVATFIVGILMIMGDAPSPPEQEYVKLSTVTGYFLQDDSATEPNGFDYVRAAVVIVTGRVV
jgi:hypothetical protein